MLGNKKSEYASNNPRRSNKIKTVYPVTSKTRPSNSKGNKNVRTQYFNNRAIRAAREHKIFTIHYNGASRIRNILKSRGWIEKCSPRYLHALQQLSDHKISIHARPGNDYEVIAMSRACKSISPNFVWHPSTFQNINGMPYRNRIQRSQRFNFTSKDGLLGCIENSYWYTIDGLSEIRSPRYHRLSVNDERIEFLKDYRTTYCLSLLKFICEEKEPTFTLFHINGSLPISLIEFAILRIQDEITYMLNDDDALDLETDENANVNSEEWQNFYYNIDALTNRTQRFRVNSVSEALNAISKCKQLYNNAKLFWPTLSSDGYHNLWILKPSYWCRGNGIVIKKNYTEIINFVNKRKNIRYIVQKYIERPLLIYRVKFDIRQYILLAITNNKFNIWMYKNCYLRFSSHEYSLDNLHQSIHITNNAVQRHYKIGKRSEKLPAHNMWSLDEFKYYLNEIKEKDTWDKQIYPSMTKNIMAVVLTSLEETDIIPNAFELYGADFMIDENFEPILLEINANPDMSCSTKVTAKICPQAVNDLVKVVLDYPKNITANTGAFELIHSIDYSKYQHSNVQINDMAIQGKTMTLLPTPEKKILKLLSRTKRLPVTDTNTTSNNIVDTIKNNIKNNKYSNIKQIHNKIKKFMARSKSKSNRYGDDGTNNFNYDDKSIKIVDNTEDNNNSSNSNEKKFIIKIVNSINNYEKQEENVQKILKNIENSLITNDKTLNKSDKNIDNNSDTNVNNKLASIRPNIDIKQIFPIFLNRSLNHSLNHHKMYNNKTTFHNKCNRYIINKPPSQNEHEIIVSKESFMKLIRNDNNSLVPIIPLSMFNSMDLPKKLNNINGNNNLKVRLTSDLKEAFSLGAVEQSS